MRRGGAGKRRDVSEPAIVQALEAVGAIVVRCHGEGAPDLIVHLGGVWTPMECKTGKGKVRKGQERYPIVRTPEEALALFR